MPLEAQRLPIRDVARHKRDERSGYGDEMLVRCLISHLRGSRMAHALGNSANCGLKRLRMRPIHNRE